MKCLYCGSDGVTVEASKGKTTKKAISALVKGIGLSFENSNSVQFLQSPLKVKCTFCEREYEIIAGEQNIEFVQDIITRAKYDLDISKEMLGYHITPEHILNGAYAVVLPRTIKNKARKWITSKVWRIGFEIHVLFNVKKSPRNEEKFYLSVYWNNNKKEIRAVHVIKIF